MCAHTHMHTHTQINACINVGPCRESLFHLNELALCVTKQIQVVYISVITMCPYVILAIITIPFTFLYSVYFHHHFYIGDL